MPDEVEIRSVADDDLETGASSTLPPSTTSSEPCAPAAEARRDEGVEEPEHLCCPITHVMFRDPAFVPETGATYEREALLRFWDSQGGAPRDPRSNVDLVSREVLTNWDKRREVAEWLSENPAVIPDGWESRDDMRPAPDSRGETTCFVKETEVDEEGNAKLVLSIPSNFNVVNIEHCKRSAPARITTPGRDRQHRMRAQGRGDDDGEDRGQCNAACLTVGQLGLWCVAIPLWNMLAAQGVVSLIAAQPDSEVMDFVNATDAVPYWAAWALDGDESAIRSSGLVRVPFPTAPSSLVVHALAPTRNLNDTDAAAADHSDLLLAVLSPGRPWREIIEGEEWRIVTALAICLFSVVIFAFMVAEARRDGVVRHFRVLVGAMATVAAINFLCAGELLEPVSLGRTELAAFAISASGTLTIHRSIAGAANTSLMLALAELTDVTAQDHGLRFHTEDSALDWSQARVSRHEVDWCLELARRALVAVAYPDQEIVHLEGPSSADEADIAQDDVASPSGQDHADAAPLSGAGPLRPVVAVTMTPWEPREGATRVINMALVTRLLSVLRPSVAVPFDDSRMDRSIDSA